MAAGKETEPVGGHISRLMEKPRVQDLVNTSPGPHLFVLGTGDVSSNFLSFAFEVA